MAGDVKNFPGGKPIVILGTDGTDLYGITVDTSGHVQVDVLSNALPTGAATETTLASVLAKLDVALSTRALEAGGNLAAILAKLDVALSTRALEVGGNLAAVLAKLDVALSTRALEAGGNLASAVTALQLIDDFALGTNKIFAYNDRYSERLTIASAPEANNFLPFTAVPAGEIWILQGLAGIDYSNIPGDIVLQVYDNSNAIVLKEWYPLTSAIWYSWTGEIVMKPGDNAYVIIYGATVGDGLFAHAWGYKMKIS